MSAEKHCPRCNEDWPADTEFFFADARSKDGLFYCCKACHTELRKKIEPRHNAPALPAARASDTLLQLRWLGVAP